MNVLKQHLQTTVLTLLAAGKSQREIARITSVDRKTIRSLVQRIDAGVSNSPGVATGSAIQIPPPRPPARASPSACEPYRSFITEQLRLRRNYTSIYQDLAYGTNKIPHLRLWRALTGTYRRSHSKYLLFKLRTKRRGLKTGSTQPAVRKKSDFHFRRVTSSV